MLTKNERKTIERLASVIIAKGQRFQLHYFSAYYGAWCTSWFYVGKGQLNIGRLNEGKELFTSVEFNMVSVNPLT